MRAKEALASITGGAGPFYTDIHQERPGIPADVIVQTLMMSDIIVADLRWASKGCFDLSKGGTVQALNKMCRLPAWHSPVYELLRDVKLRALERPRTRRPAIVAFADNPERKHFKPLHSILTLSMVHLVYPAQEDMPWLARDIEDVFRPSPAKRLPSPKPPSSGLV